MSTVILLDSKDRDRSVSPNQANFTVNANQTAGWPDLSREVVCVRPCARKEVCNPFFSVKLLWLQLPGTTTNASGANLVDNEPYIYIRISDTRNPTRRAIKTIGNVSSDAVFAATFTKYQGAGNEWATYGSIQNQPLKLASYKPELEFRVFTREGTPAIPLTSPQNNTVIPPADTPLPGLIDPTVQISAMFELVPYIRDGEYDNQTTPISQ